MSRAPEGRGGWPPNPRARAEPRAPPAAAGCRGSLFPTPLGRKVYSEAAAAPREGSSVHPALPPARGG